MTQNPGGGTKRPREDTTATLADILDGSGAKLFKLNIGDSTTQTAAVLCMLWKSTEQVEKRLMTPSSILTEP